MNSLLYILVSVLIVAILYAIFRILHILDVIKGHKEENISDFHNRFQPIVLLLVIGAGMYWFFSYGSSAFERYTLPVASEHGRIVEDMFWLTMVLILIVFVGTHVVLCLFALLYRYNKNRTASYYHENDKLELVWTIIPGLVLMGLIFNGLREWIRITSEAPPEAEVIEVVGYQFAWGVRYGGKDGKLGAADYRLIDAENRTGIDFADPVAQDDFVAREIHIPKGHPVKFRIRALDVIHSFYAPHFRLQMYAVPGMETTFWLTPTKTTEEMRKELDNPDFNYEIACNKLCGKGHFAMRYVLVVEEPEQYAAWYDAQESWLEKHPEYQAKLQEKQSLTLQKNP